MTRRFSPSSSSRLKTHRRRGGPPVLATRRGEGLRFSQPDVGEGLRPLPRQGQHRPAGTEAHPYDGEGGGLVTIPGDCGYDGRALSSTRRNSRSIGVALVLALVAVAAPAQELAPRAYWPAPRGAKLVSFGYGYSDGDIVIDASLPFDIEAQTDSLSVGFLQFFSLAGRTASWNVEVPMAATSLEATINGRALGRSLSGFADLKLRLAINLIGAPSMTAPEFQTYLENPRRALGVSLRIQAPTGDYNPSRAANIGTSRWAAKPELGYLQPLGNRWVFEAALGVWLYGNNSNFLKRKLEQDPLYSGEIHLIRSLHAGFWASLDLNFYSGGGTTVGSIKLDNKLENSRIGATIAYPFNRRHVLKLAFSTGLTIESGGDYDSVLLGYSYGWR